MKSKTLYAVLLIIALCFSVQPTFASSCYNQLQADYHVINTTINDFSNHQLFHETPHFVIFADKHSSNFQHYDKTLLNILYNNLELSFNYFNCQMGFLPSDTHYKLHVYLDHSTTLRAGSAPYGQNYITISDYLLVGPQIDDKLITAPAHEYFHKLQYKLGFNSYSIIFEGIASLAERLPSNTHFYRSIKQRISTFIHPEGVNSFTPYSNAIFWQFLLEQIHGPLTQTLTRDAPANNMLMTLTEIAYQSNSNVRTVLQNYVTSEVTHSSSSQTDIAVMDNFITAKYSYSFIDTTLYPQFGFWHKQNYINNGYQLGIYQTHSLSAGSQLQLDNTNTYYRTGSMADSGFIGFLAAEYHVLNINNSVKGLNVKSLLLDDDIRMQVILKYSDNTLDRYIIDSNNPSLKLVKPQNAIIDEVVFVAYTIKSNPWIGTTGRHFNVEIKAF